MVIRVQLDVQNGDIWFWVGIALDIHFGYSKDARK